MLGVGIVEQFRGAFFKGNAMFNYVVQRDTDGTWSVRERETNAIVLTVAGQTLSGLSEANAVRHARRLNMNSDLAASLADAA